MHSGRKGKSGSTKPPTKQTVDWIEYKPKEVEELIVSLYNSGLTPSEIGMVLRDQYGIPNVKRFLNKSIETVLAEHNLTAEFPRDLLNLIKKLVSLQKHLKENKKDFTAKRGLQLTESKIRRLTKYYHSAGKVSKQWRYSPEQAALLVK